jgi:flavodoxin
MHGILYYSTISGNTRLVGEALQGTFANAGITLTLQDVAEDTTWNKEERINKKEDMMEYFVIFACGTYGHGQLEKTMRKYCEETWKDVKLNWILCAAIGLGDHRYDVEYNIYSADQLESWITERGGNLICPALRINRSPVKPNNQKIIENWAALFIQNLRKCIE